MRHRSLVYREWREKVESGISGGISGTQANTREMYTICSLDGATYQKEHIIELCEQEYYLLWYSYKSELRRADTTTVQSNMCPGLW